MPLTDSDLALVRSHVGPAPPSDDDLNDAYDRLGSVAAVALEVLRTRLGALTAGPAVLSIAGQMSVDSRWTIDLLQAKIAELELDVGVVAGDTTAGVLGVVDLVRTDRTR